MVITVTLMVCTIDYLSMGTPGSKLITRLATMFYELVPSQNYVVMHALALGTGRE